MLRKRVLALGCSISRERPLCAYQKVLLPIAFNRDESRWERPDRRVAGHIAFGTGIHGCVGQMVARLEGEGALGQRDRPAVR